MNHGHHHGAIGAAALVAAIAFAFGPRVARFVVGAALILAAVFFGGIFLFVILGGTD